MTPKQKRFCEEYLLDLNATAAYKRAGYKAEGNAAEVNASKLLRNAKVYARIEELKKERSEKTKINAEWVIKKLVDVVERAMTAEPVMVFDPESRTLVESGEYQFDSNGANKALELLGKHIGMFDPKHNMIQPLTGSQIEKIQAETDFIKERTKLLKGTAKDTSLMQSLIDVFKSDK